MKFRHRQLRKFLAPILVFAVGAGIFLYPAVSNFLAEQNQEKVIHTYNAVVESSSSETLDAEWKKAEEYNENLAGDPVHDPFVPGSGFAIPDNYNDVLNLNGDGVMGYIEIPKIDVYLPIYHGSDAETLQKGAGHIETTSLPIGGLNRHAVISAHRGLPSAELFTRLDEMEEGDLFYIQVLNQTLTYEVDQINVIDPDELTLLRPEKDKDLVTLLTCTPYGVNTQRLLVRGERTTRTASDSGNEDRIIPRNFDWLPLYLLSVDIGLIIVLIIIILRRRKKKNEKKNKKKNQAKRL